MPATNQKLAELFQEMADVMQVLGVDTFKVKAFEKVARSLETFEQDVAEIGPDEKRLTAIEGVGAGSAKRIAEYLRTGKIKDHEDLIAQFPPTLRPLMRLPGLGHKTVALLWKECGIKSLDDLKEKLKTEELCAVKGMGKKKVEALRKSLEFVQSTGTRVRIGGALPIAIWLSERLRAIGGVEEATYAGSLRRGKETAGNINLVAAAKPAKMSAIVDAFVKLGPVAEVLERFEDGARVRTRRDGTDGTEVDLRLVPREAYGAALVYYTGSRAHVESLIKRAAERKLKLTPVGLLDAKGRALPAVTEEDVYRALGLPLIPPELREGVGELALAVMPKLVRVEDIRAELHAHTTASDGSWSIRELASAAIDRGFHTLAITDHSKSQVIANGLSEARLEKHVEEVRRVAAELRGKITVLTGAEVDILADGTLDYSNNVLKELDVVVASPHAALTQEPAKATKRILRAMENPYVTIMGHPTGRIVNRRAGVSPDMKKIVKAAAERGVALEINANHYRLDLRDTHARMALEAGVKLSINTDAHGPADLDELKYGVLTARRAGARPEDVVNCLEPAALRGWIAGTKGSRFKVQSSKLEEEDAADEPSLFTPRA